MINQGAKKVTSLKQIKKAVTRHPIYFSSFSSSSKQKLTKILDHERKILVASDHASGKP